MEKAMRRLLLLVALLGATERVAAQETVETRGITSEVKLEEVTFGHLTELNGKFNYVPLNSRLPQTAMSEYITTLGPAFDM
jgi:hypothetical protein